MKRIQKKLAKGPQKDKPVPVPTPGKPKPNEEEIDPSKYTENRKKYIQSIRDANQNPYPHKFQRSHRIDEFREEFDGECKENGAFKDDVIV